MTLTLTVSGCGDESSSAGDAGAMDSGNDAGVDAGAGCAQSADCDDGNDCTEEVCEVATGACSNPPVAAGTPSGTQTTGDCHQRQCDGAGGSSDVVDDTDSGDDGNVCTVEACNGGTPEPSFAALGSSCALGLCDGAGLCIECGDGSCDSSEDATNCAIDCSTASRCGDLTCDPNESIAGCQTDCDPSAPTCGDALCAPSETKLNCALDCCTMTLGCTPFTCDDGDTIGGSYACDASPHCTDGSDESGCGTDFVCGNDELGSPLTVASALVCDGAPDCDFSQDEANCGGEMHACADGSNMISTAQVCDGVVDCHDLGDEFDCVGLPAFVGVYDLTESAMGAAFVMVIDAAGVITMSMDVSALPTLDGSAHFMDSIQRNGEFQIVRGWTLTDPAVPLSLAGVIAPDGTVTGSFDLGALGSGTLDGTRRPPAVCGDGACTALQEDCSSCAADCGPCGWSCQAAAFGDGLCDCGCGIPDIDCTTGDISDCAVCFGSGGCGDPGCTSIDRMDTTRCLEVPDCGDSLCSPYLGEDPNSCPTDCGALAAWSCDYYLLQNFECDCGCGVVEPDCADATAASCDGCAETGSCSEGLPVCTRIDPADNSQCVPPSCGDMICDDGETCDSCASDCGACVWTCSAPSMGDGVCDCGCGAPDPDCANDTAAACDVCGGSGSCAVGANCNRMDPNANFQCLPPVCGDGLCDGTEDCTSCSGDCGPCTWTCELEFYGDGSCDCGCGAYDDMDCADMSVGSCDFCGIPGACNEGSMDCGLIDPLDNALCI